MTTGTGDKNLQATGSAQVGLNQPAPSKGLDGKEAGAEQEKTYRQSEVDALLGKAGQKIGAKLEVITTERDTLKSERDTLTAEITEARTQIEALTKDIEAMSEDDPDKHELVKRRKEYEAEVKSAKAERATIAESKKEVEKWQRDQRVYTVADEFVTASGESIDFDSFMTAADRFNLGKTEELEALAETMGFKSKSEAAETTKTANPPLKPDSSRTLGGGKTDSQIIKDYADNPHDRQAKQAYIELMAKRK